MSKVEILAQLPQLTKQERDESRGKLAELDIDQGWLDDDDLLADQEKQLIDTRLAEHEANPQSAIPLEEFKARIRSQA